MDDDQRKSAKESMAKLFKYNKNDLGIQWNFEYNNIPITITYGYPYKNKTIILNF